MTQLSSQLIRKDLDEATLISLAKNGNTSAFEKLIKRYEEKIYSLAYRILQDKEEAFDVLQDTAMSAFKNLKNFQSKSSFSTWIYRIALNFALMRKRKQKAQLKKAQIIDSEDSDKLPQFAEIAEQNLLGNYVDWSENPVISLENQELRKVLQEAINKLPDKYRNVIILKEIEGRSIEETAKILGLSISAVKTRLHRARLYLKWFLEKYITKGQMV
ncbi:MAG: sigma-70 family RNA polymerase sigma factor [Elusimicrobiota bacterium]|nr:sigma-70 family RNA polymerase sigma factor [Endomicrobiia bacterium]MDW8165934.1 sigma-70 family RNA polymerase sigma factor [Elusimicrobiota bacterium]